MEYGKMYCFRWKIPDYEWPGVFHEVKKWIKGNNIWQTVGFAKKYIIPSRAEKVQALFKNEWRFI